MYFQTAHVIVALTIFFLPTRWSLLVYAVVTAFCFFALATIQDVNWGTGLARGAAVQMTLASSAGMLARLCVRAAVFVYRNTPR